ncbi:MAG: hypothetical protein D4R88_01985 [Methanosarcinales archaeon]|nr:MAG: hypothetical protein D4R88_01985 [Methanosarcinales archaeon]
MGLAHKDMSWKIKFDDLRPGDILLLNTHHVMLFKEFTDSDKTELTVYEASSNDWKVSERNYTVAELISGGYLPYTYNPIKKGLLYLRKIQNPDGSWTGRFGKNVGYTALGVLPFLNNGISESDPTVSKAINYILSNKKPDGSIYVSYSNYETSLAILPLVATHNSAYDSDITAAKNFLVNIQNDETEGLTNSNWQYGGWGYQGNSPSWSDLSNTQWDLMGLDAANLPKTDNTWSKAELYITRSQNLHATNPVYDMTNDGGFTYQPPKISCCWAGSNSYGSMTAAGVWGLRLTGVDMADQRVQAGLNWLRNHYAPIDTVKNPVIGGDLLYYYLLSFAKGLIMTEIPTGSWQETASNDITNYIVSKQNTDGHWTSYGGDEDDLLATEEAILSLQTRIIPTDIQRLSYLTFILHSNADLHVYDPIGRHVGKNYETGEIDNEIPGATYANNANQEINIQGLEPGNYKVKLVGTGAGEYTLEVKGGVGDTVVSEDSFTSTISQSEVQEGNVNVAIITGLTILIEKPESKTQPTKLEYTGDLIAQYSDSVTLKAKLSDSGNNPLSDKTISFTLGTQTATAITGADGIASITIKLGQPAGSYNVKAEFAGDANYGSNSDTKSFSITREDATITYTGDMIVPRTSGSINLRATLEEIDTDYGDLTKIKVNFTIYKSGDLTYSNPITTVPSVASVSVTSSGTGIGTAKATINNLPVDDYMVIARIVPNDYYKPITSAPTPLIVYEPTGKFTTGGGWILDPVGSHGNFGFTVKYNKQGKVQGNSLYIYRQNGLDYIVKSNAWIGLAIKGITSSFQGKASLQIYDPAAGLIQPGSSGNFQFTVEAVDNELSKTLDTYKITVLDKDGLVYHTATGQLQGGNIVIHEK